MFSACNSYPLRGGVGAKVRLLTHPVFTHQPPREAAPSLRRYGQYWHGATSVITHWTLQPVGGITPDACIGK